MRQGHRINSRFWSNIPCPLEYTALLKVAFLLRIEVLLFSLFLAVNE